VLDIGGWAKPFARADWVMDVFPYETRGAYGRDGEGPERFREDTWIQRDICDREPYPFADDELDFVVCSHTLEDVRDPIWVCSETIRIGKAGYIEVPSRLEEQCHGFQGPWVGWGHHRWLIDVFENRIEFVFKHQVIHGRESDHFPDWFHATLTPEERVQTLWWEGGFEFGERIFLEPQAVDRYMAEFVAQHLPPRQRARPGKDLLARVLGKARSGVFRRGARARLGGRDGLRPR
jgi:hypothetical protein